MAKRMNFTVAAIAILVIAAACGPSKPTTSALSRPSPTHASVPTKTSAPVSLVLETGSPPRPPSVSLVVHSDTHDIVVKGVPVVTGEWITDKNVSQEDLHRTIPWPSLTTINGGDNPTIEFHTPYVPDFVVVKTYADLDKLNQVPSGLPRTTFSCNQFTAPRCQIVASKSGFRVFGLNQTIYSGTFIVVYAEWHLPTKVAGSGVYAQGSLPASWLFRVIHTRATGP